MNEKLTYTSTTPQPGEVCGDEDCNNAATEAFRGKYGDQWAAAIPTCAEHATRLIDALFAGRELVEHRIKTEVEQLWRDSGLDDATRKKYDQIWRSAFGVGRANL